MTGRTDTRPESGAAPVGTMGPEEPAAVRRSGLDISVVIPVFNEEERIINTVSLLSRYLDKLGESYEVIISDDGSHDDGPRMVQKRFADSDQVRLIRDDRNRGKGAAVRRGVLAARGDIIIFTDADLSYPVETIHLCVEALREHDIAVGSRNLPGSEIQVTPSPMRRLTGTVFKTLVRRLVVSGFTDTQCGFKGFRSQAAHDIFSNCRANGFAFDVEALALARLLGYSIAEVPVRLQVDSSDSTINLTSDPVAMMGELFAIRRHIKKLKSRNQA
ncbi:MAG: dolichyl-phosphate beta-glucosyltransferase [Thermoleophilia bacterium]